MRDPDKPQQIIEAALRVFARKGYFNSRVSDIAREAGIAAGTIYLYFDTKEEILITLFREKMAGFVETAAGHCRGARRRRQAAAARPASFPDPGGQSRVAEVVQVELRQGQKLFRGANQEDRRVFRPDRLRPSRRARRPGASPPTCP